MLIIPLENSQNNWQKPAKCINHIEHVILKVIQTCNHVTILKNTHETKGAFQSLQRKTQNKNDTVSAWISTNISGNYVCLSSLLGGLSNYITYWTALLFCHLHQWILKTNNIMHSAKVWNFPKGIRTKNKSTCADINRATDFLLDSWSSPAINSSSNI